MREVRPAQALVSASVLPPVRGLPRSSFDSRSPAAQGRSSAQDRRAQALGRAKAAAISGAQAERRELRRGAHALHVTCQNRRVAEALDDQLKRRQCGSAGREWLPTEPQQAGTRRVYPPPLVFRPLSICRRAKLRVLADPSRRRVCSWSRGTPNEPKPSRFRRDLKPRGADRSPFRSAEVSQRSWKGHTASSVMAREAALSLRCSDPARSRRNPRYRAGHTASASQPARTGRDVPGIPCRVTGARGLRR